MRTNEIIKTDLPPVPDWIIDRTSNKQLSENSNNGSSNAGDILEGTRNDTLFKEGCRMRRQGSSYEEIFNALWEINNERCSLPLSREEVNDIAHQAANYEIGTGNDYSKSNEQEGETSGIYASLAEMLNADIPDTEEIICGIGRGEVGMLVSVTNIGKTTLMLNLGLSLAAGRSYLPFAPKVANPIRVLYCDFEARDSKQKPYLTKMLPNIGSSDLAKTNFIPINTPVLQDEQMNLSNSAHIKYLTDYAKKHKADLIIIDTVGAAFDLNDENSNAEVTKRAMKPMIKMAREANAAVLFCHHTGKPNESSIGVKAYSARGASAWGALSRASFLLTRDKKKGTDYIVLECAKIKGQAFDPVLLRLNRDAAWFEICNERPEIEQDFTSQEIAAWVNSKGEVKRKAILENFKGRASDETIDRRIEDAVRYGFISKPQRGLYSSRANAK